MTMMTNSSDASTIDSQADPMMDLSARFSEGQRRKETRDFFVQTLARFVLTHPDYELEAFKHAAETLDANTEQLRKQVENFNAVTDAHLLSQNVLDSMCTLGNYDYPIADLICSSVANHIDASCRRNNGDILPHLLSLLTVAGALIGGHVRVYSGIEDGDLPLSLRYLNVADTSDGKSKTTKKGVGPTLAISNKDKLRIQAELEQLEKLQTYKDEQGNEQSINTEERKKMKRGILSNERAVLLDSKSFSAEALIKKLTKQADKAGLLLYRDEASDMLQHERYGAKGSGSTSQTTGLLKSTIMTSQTECLYGSVDRVNEDNAGEFNGQTLSVLGNIQLHFLPDVIDFSDDSHGWGSRWILSRANRKGLPEVVNTLKSNDPLNRFVAERLIPFLMGIKPIDAVEENISGLPVDYIRLGFCTEAQAVYNAYVTESRQRIESQRRIDAKEASYLSWLAKDSIRIPVIAALLHCLELLEGTHGDTVRTVESDIKPDLTNERLVVRSFNSNRAFKPDRSELKSFDDIIGNGWLTISEENVRRAIRVEQMLSDEFLIISDEASIAVRTRQVAQVNNQLRTDLRFILQKLQDKGDMTQAAFKSSLRGGRLRMSGSDLQGRIDELVARGCIKRWTEGKTYLAYEKPLRG